MESYFRPGGWEVTEADSSDNFVPTGDKVINKKEFEAVGAEAQSCGDRIRLCSVTERESREIRMTDKNIPIGNNHTGREELFMLEAQNCRAQKQAAAQQLWMQYFNHYLFDRKMITEEERNRMAVRIDGRFGNFQNSPRVPKSHSGYLQ